MKKTAVIIPYYQVEKGILRRSLQSVIRQYLPDGYHADIIITDDGSPISAESELDGLTYSDQFSFRIIKKENGGAASARNAALKEISKDTDYVAFLDSDDLWSPTHLHQGIQALELGHDFYFTDNQRAGFHESYFNNSCPEIFKLLNAPEIADSVYTIPPDEVLDIIVKRFPSQASTTIMRRELLGDLTFNEDLKFAGEDVLFFSTIASRSKAPCLSKKIMVECADGINIFFKNYGWDSPKKINIIIDHIKLRDLLLKNINLAQKTQNYLNWITEGYKDDFIFFSMRSMLKTRTFDKTFIASASQIGISALKLPFLMIKILLAKPLNLYTPVS